MICIQVEIFFFKHFVLCEGNREYFDMGFSNFTLFATLIDEYIQSLPLPQET
jgi:hypothetical protein